MTALTNTNKILALEICNSNRESFRLHARSLFLQTLEPPVSAPAGNQIFSLVQKKHRFFRPSQSVLEHSPLSFGWLPLCVYSSLIQYLSARVSSYSQSLCTAHDFSFCDALSTCALCASEWRRVYLCQCPRVFADEITGPSFFHCGVRSVGVPLFHFAVAFRTFWSKQCGKAQTAAPKKDRRRKHDFALWNIYRSLTVRARDLREEWAKHREQKGLYF